MKRDMELIRKILFIMEEQYNPAKGSMVNLKIDGYELPVVAEHCKILYEEGLLSEYRPQYGGNKLLLFAIGGLTYKGYDFLDTIRDDEMWGKINKRAEKEKIPKTIQNISAIAGTFIGSVIKSMND